MGLTITVEPTVEPVSNDDLRTFLRLDDDFENDTLTQIKTAARRTLEAWTNRVFIDTTFEFCRSARCRPSLRFSISTRRKLNKHGPRAITKWTRPGYSRAFAWSRA